MADFKGDSNDNEINGTNEDDKISGGAGNDTLRGRDGHDEIDGDDGDDLIYGGNGDDTLDGGRGRDTIYGGEGNDTITGGSGSGSSGSGSGSSHSDADDDMLYGEGGQDNISGGGGDDLLDGGEGDDTLDGGSGDDTLYGGGGQDELDGGKGNDMLDGGQGDDTLDGGSGNDTLYGGQGQDEIYGGKGNDTAYGDDGDDTIYGGTGDDRLFGGQGQDKLYGGKGDDVLAGGDGDDTLEGGTGDDVLAGNANNDTLRGGKGDDILCGDDGDDKLYGGTGNDQLYGGAGNDIMYGGKNGSGTGSGSSIGGDSFYVGRQGGGVDTVYGGDGGSKGGSASGQDLNDVLYVEGPVRVTLESGETFTLSPGEMRQIVDEDDHIDDDLQDGGYATLDDGTRVNFQDIGAIRSVENIERPEQCICFTPGAQIATARGLVPVETLKQGDRVLTRDNGFQTISWTGARQLSAEELAQNEQLRPVLIRAGSIGPNCPEVDMLVSPSHRMLVTGNRAELLMEHREVLVSAKHMVSQEGIDKVQPARGVTYVHIMCEQHEVIMADGAWTESFQPGDYSLDGLGQPQREEIFALFPELRTTRGTEAFSASRMVAKKHEARLLLG
ncbi:MAG: Hint domain-containing protein [Celeribacter sp.]